ncbi:MAG: bacteriocin family protein [Polyangiaceae bacterium]|nr:bacteriocin family protein [Myxococcales bacterium]MCB9584852.1 bacteriocin family protein [Polyangiaceae bacterium]MCB9607575.1 bacteriocin family protein [Polyangiaceae bacterium]
MDFLRQRLAPISGAAWAAVEAEVAGVLRTRLSTRRVVDVDGPKGFDFSALNLGRVSTPESQEARVQYGVRQVQPLVEVRVPFELEQWELDNLSRGADDVNLDPAVDAAIQLATFEERAVYNGFAQGGITGLNSAKHHEAIRWNRDPEALPKLVASGLARFREQGVDGPYALVLDTKSYRELSAAGESYPPRKLLARTLEGDIIHAPDAPKPMLLSMRGGDFTTTIGQDCSLGYEAHTATHLRLYLTETFTFRMTGPEAVIRFE